MSDDLLKLAERCEKASGPDWTLNAEIEIAVRGFPERAYQQQNGPRPKGAPAIDRLEFVRKGWASDFTGSIDAAMTLVPEGLELAIYTNWVLTAGFPEEEGGGVLITDEMPRGCWVRSYGGANPFKDVRGLARTTAMAICAAALRARARLAA